MPNNRYKSHEERLIIDLLMWRICFDSFTKIQNIIIIRKMNSETTETFWII